MKNKSIKFDKLNHLFQKVVFVDGIAHSGKILIGPILSTYKNVELQRFDTVLEHIAVLYHYNKISLDGAVTLMRNYVDESFYDSMIGRNINFRPTDLSSVFFGKNQRKYIERLFKEEGDVVTERIKNEKPIFQTLTHEILGFINPAFEAFGDNLYILEVIRHPVDVINSWINRGWGNDRFLSDPRSFIISLDYEGNQIPYYAYGCRETFVNMTPQERVTNCIYSCFSQSRKTYKSLSAKRKKHILFINFDDLAENTFKELNRIKDFLDIEEGGSLNEVIAQQGCPRKIDMKLRAKKSEEYFKHFSKPEKSMLNSMIKEYEEMKLLNIYE